MWKVPRPTSNVRTTFPLSVSGVPSQTLRDKLTGATDAVVSKSDAFVQTMTGGSGFEFDRTRYQLSPVTKDEMRDLYEKQFAPDGSAGRDEYLAIRDLAEWCPACNHDLAEEVDHFLPKTVFPALAVTPENLTPICTRCNRAKSTGYRATDSTAYVHPYFDDFESALWLTAIAVPTPVAHVEFGVHAAGWSATEVSRMEEHLTRFKLRRFFGLQAGKAAVNAKRDLEIHWAGHDDAAVRTECERNAATHRAVSLNSWEVATWTAFAKSEWFCAGGFLEF